MLFAPFLYQEKTVPGSQLYLDYEITLLCQVGLKADKSDRKLNEILKACAVVNMPMTLPLNLSEIFELTNGTCFLPVGLGSLQVAAEGQREASRDSCNVNRLGKSAVRVDGPLMQSEHRDQHPRARDIAVSLNAGEWRNGVFGSLMSVDTQKLWSKAPQIHL